MTEQRRSKLKYRLQQSRMRLGLKGDSFGELLYGVLFVAVKGLGRISTNGHCIYFDSDWLGSLGDNELETGDVKIKNMRTGEQTDAKLDGFVKSLEELYVNEICETDNPFSRAVIEALGGEK